MMALDDHLSRPEIFQIVASLVFAVSVPLGFKIFYRLYFHPLRNVPGPWLAALSDLYGVYHNVVGKGYSKRFESLHKYYASPVIRIGPNHVHINRPEFFDEIFQSGSNYKKDVSFYKHFGGLDSMIDPEDYRTYRIHIASLYSTKHIDGLAPRLLLNLQSMAGHLKRTIGTSEVVNIERMFRTLSANMVLHLVFPQDINLFECDGYHPLLAAIDVMMSKAWLMLTYPFMGMALSIIPFTGYSKLKWAFDEYTKYFQGWANEAQLLLASRDQSERDCHITRFLDIDRNDKIRLKAVLYPLKDLFNFISGGRDTTAYSMSCALYYLCSSPIAFTKLRSELDSSISCIREKFDHKKIQSLPYLNAVVKETLRLSSPVPGCLPRIVPEGGASVESIYLPAGVAVSVSLLSVQHNSDLFPEPLRFLPERWLEGDKSIQKWNIAFSKGPRQCIGINLAYLELHSCLAYLLSHFEFSLPKCVAKELEWVDHFVATNIEDVEITVQGDRWT